MKRVLLYCTIVCLQISSLPKLLAQTAPAIQWDKTYGTNQTDQLYSVKQTTDGGFIAIGSSSGGMNGDKSQPSKGNADYWIIKLDGNGNKVWDKSIGTAAHDFPGDIIQTADGGYLASGTSDSGINGDKTQPSRGGRDIWLVKLDALGNLQWDKTIGGNGDDSGAILYQTPSGDYVVGGGSSSGISGEKSQASKGGFDIWIIKINSLGVKIWDRTIGGSGSEAVIAMSPTSDGGFIIGSSSNSPLSGDKSQPFMGGSNDYWVVKIDSLGFKVWDKTYGGSGYDFFKNVVQTIDGGYVIIGRSDSPISSEKSQASNGSKDYWLIRTDALGNRIWDKSIGGIDEEFASSIHQTRDGGFLLIGFTYSGIGGDKTQPSKGDADYWIVKLENNGNKVWDKSIGGNGGDMVISNYQTADGGFILGGDSDSGISGDKSQVSKGGRDYWFVKLAPEVLGINELPTSTLNLYPNPTSGIVNLELYNHEASQVLVYNSLGQLVFTKDVVKTPNEDQIQIDLTKEAKGVYTIQVLSDNQVTTRKVVLQ